MLLCSSRRDADLASESWRVLPCLGRTAAFLGWATAFVGWAIAFLGWVLWADASVGQQWHWHIWRLFDGHCPHALAAPRDAGLARECHLVLNAPGSGCVPASPALPQPCPPPASAQPNPPCPPTSSTPAVKRLNGSTTAFRNYGVAHAVGAYTAEEAAATAGTAAAAEQPAGEGGEAAAADGAAKEGAPAEGTPAEGAAGDKPAEQAKLIVSIAQSSVKQMRPGERPPEWMRQGPMGMGGPYRPVPPGEVKVPLSWRWWWEVQVVARVQGGQAYHAAARAVGSARAVQTCRRRSGRPLHGRGRKTLTGTGPPTCTLHPSRRLHPPPPPIAGAPPLNMPAPGGPPPGWGAPPAWGPPPQQGGYYGGAPGWGAAAPPQPAYDPYAYQQQAAYPPQQGWQQPAQAWPQQPSPAAPSPVAPPAAAPAYPSAYPAQQPYAAQPGQPAAAPAGAPPAYGAAPAGQPYQQPVGGYASYPGAQQQAPAQQAPPQQYYPQQGGY